jgi:glycosyltransferase involved in cell wall biosynthesis
MPLDLRLLAGDDIIIAGYVNNVAEVYQSCRIFIAPLLSGAGIKGKVIGALAAGVPTIMTSLAGEGVGIRRGFEAVIANDSSEWVGAIATLYNDEKRWTEMSRHALQFARENFSFESGLKTMSAALAMAGVYVG